MIRVGHGKDLVSNGLGLAVLTLSRLIQLD
jgi:hypothetical protein